MSVFPTKILLATDGSSEAQLAARTALELTQKTDSELHTIHIVDVAASTALLYPEATDPQRVERQIVAGVLNVLCAHCRHIQLYKRHSS
jgi:nucleotide-binding universal stress UspA family protein